MKTQLGFASRKISILTALGLFVFCRLLYGFDDPNLAYESFLHQIYQGYYSKPLSAQDWNRLVNERKVEKYQIQSGDTLWDVSRTFFGDGNYWPKLWSLNSQFEDPHVITPRAELHFFLGSESAPPGFAVVEGQSEASENNTVEETASVQSGGDEFIIPEPTTEPKPLMRRLPPSLPEWHYMETGNFDKLGMELLKRRIASVDPYLPLPLFLSETDPSYDGRVIENEDSGIISTTFQYVYVRSEALKVGDKVLFFREGPPAKDLDIVYGKRAVRVFEVLGEGQVTQDLTLIEKRKVWRVELTNTIAEVSRDAFVRKGAIEYVLANDEGPPSKVSAKIIGGQLDSKRVLFGAKQLVILDKGLKQGLQKGNVLDIIMNRSARTGRPLPVTNRVIIGQAKVFDLTDNFSVAVVIRSSQELVPGDLTGSGEWTKKDLERIARQSDVEMPPEKPPTKLESELEPIDEDESESQ